MNDLLDAARDYWPHTGTIVVLGLMVAQILTVKFLVDAFVGSKVEQMGRDLRLQLFERFDQLARQLDQ